MTDAQEKSGRWEYGSFDDRADLFMESLGDVFGLLATLGLKEADAVNILREARVAQTINAAKTLQLTFSYDDKSVTSVAIRSFQNSYSNQLPEFDQ